MNQVHYFANDGNFGDATGIAFIETNEWTEEDFDLVAGGVSNNRIPADCARLVALYVRLGRPEDFFEDLDGLGVAGKYMHLLKQVF
jgi:hypothetical protein